MSNDQVPGIRGQEWGEMPPTVPTRVPLPHRSRLSEYESGEPRPPSPGQQAIILAMLMIGILMMGVQLWLLTVALELYLGGNGSDVLWLALISGLIFLGGLLVLRVLGRRPRVGGW
ncbi:MAG: hypothetical protein M5U01_10980 [Ardenticatenaceae bacterium]|nr:hypothetical protein [Ardenticatenaceae bacterium]HBY95716.1 hypothetical protein [Chloroflexota bacterium]